MSAQNSHPLSCATRGAQQRAQRGLDQSRRFDAGPHRAYRTENRRPAAMRLRRRFDALIAYKRGNAQNDPELFATYSALASEVDGAVRAHVHVLVSQVARIIEEGVAAGAFAPADPLASARALLCATARFHNPVHAAEWRSPDSDAAFEEVWALVARGLAA
jgi:AcrR family transcriptional regulator